VKLPGAVSPMGGVNSGGEIYLVAESPGPKSNAVKFVSLCRYHDRFLRYLRSKSKVVLNRAKF